MSSIDSEKHPTESRCAHTCERYCIVKQLGDKGKPKKMHNYAKALAMQIAF